MQEKILCELSVNEINDITGGRRRRSANANAACICHCAIQDGGSQYLGPVSDVDYCASVCGYRGQRIYACYPLN